jgi:hypothetical protein
MRWLINYIRSCFCKHEWEYETFDEIKVDRPPYGMYCVGDAAIPHKIIVGQTVSATCKKCGWHRSYRKF